MRRNEPLVNTDGRGEKDKTGPKKTRNSLTNFIIPMQIQSELCNLFVVQSQTENWVTEEPKENDYLIHGDV